MATGKTATLSFRIEANLKEALRNVAELEHRGTANTVAVMIREYCGQNGVTVAEQGALMPPRSQPHEENEAIRECARKVSVDYIRLTQQRTQV